MKKLFKVRIKCWVGLLALSSLVEFFDAAVSFVKKPRQKSWDVFGVWLLQVTCSLYLNTTDLFPVALTEPGGFPFPLWRLG